MYVMKFLTRVSISLSVFVGLFPAFLVAQQFGAVQGVIRDAATGEEVPGATVILVDASRGSTSDEKGEFRIAVVPTGHYALKVSFVGYSELLLEDVKVQSGGETVLEIQLEPNGESIDEVLVTTSRRRDREIGLLAERQHATLTVQKIGAQELDRRGVSDAANAVAKMSGISQSAGNNQIYVRGLGDRYNATSLNGLPLPSNDPENKNIVLDMFNTEIVEFISVDKVYNSQMPGDFAGGVIDIYSKEYTGPGMFEVSVSSTVNSGVRKQRDHFMLRPGPDRWGYSDYKIPQDPLNGFRFHQTLNAEPRTPYPASLRLRGGKSFDLGSERRVNFFASASFGNDYEYRDGFTGSVNAQGADLLSLDQRRFGYQTNTTGLFNTNYLHSARHKFSYNLLFINEGKQANDLYTGFIRDLAEDHNGLLQRETYTQTTLLINQLLGRHTLTDRMELKWGLSANTVDGKMPDRIQNTLRYQPTQQGYTLIQNTTTDNHRYNQRLDEREFALNLQAAYQLGDALGPQGIVHVGYSGRMKRRDFEAIQFNFRVGGPSLSQIVDPGNLDAFFNAANYDDGYFRIESFAGETPQTYSGIQDIHAGFVSWEQQWTDRLTSVLGIRYEYLVQGVDWRTQLDPDARSNTFSKHAFLPNLNLKYELTDRQNIRLGASKTYTLPQFKERALFVYEDIPDKKRGNPHLYPSDNYNLDIKWEFFPNSSEILSLTAFGKYILNPINETTIASSSNDISFINAGDVGTVMGVELELRKNIFALRDGVDGLSLGFNAAYMRTSQDLDSEKVARETDLKINLTHDRARFTGASDLLLNADLTYTKRWAAQRSVMSTLAYSYVSDKIYSLGEEQKGNTVDLGVGMLDLVVKSMLTSRLGVDISAKNLLDPVYRRVQENASGHLPVLSYKRGRFFSMGMSYRF